MKIIFNDDNKSEIQNFLGGEGVFEAHIVNDGLNKIIKGKLMPNSSIGKHAHENSSEIMFIVSGEGTAICDGIEYDLKEGDCHYCKKGSSHTLINTGANPLCFYAVVPVQ